MTNPDINIMLTEEALSKGYHLSEDRTQILDAFNDLVEFVHVGREYPLSNNYNYSYENFERDINYPEYKDYGPASIDEEAVLEEEYQNVNKDNPGKYEDYGIDSKLGYYN